MHPGLPWQSLLTLSVRHASPAGCTTVIMRCASVLYARGAACTETCFGKAYDTFSVTCQPCWLHDCRHALRIGAICAGGRMHLGLPWQCLLTLSVGHASPAGGMIVIMRSFSQHSCGMLMHAVADATWHISRCLRWRTTDKPSLLTA